MQIPGKLFLVLGLGAFVLAILSFFVRVAFGDTVSTPFFLGAFGAAALAFVLAMLVKIGLVELDVPAESDG